MIRPEQRPVANLCSTRQHQLVAGVVKDSEVHLGLRVFLVWVAGGVVVPLVVLQQRVALVQELAVAFVQHVSLHVLHGAEPLPPVVTPETHVTLSNLGPQVAHQTFQVADELGVREEEGVGEGHVG